VAGRGEGSGTGSSGTGGGQAFTARARQVVAQWARSPVARVWRSGLVLLSPDELTAQATFRQLAADQACAFPGCGHLTIIAARPANLVILTSKGPATVPAWSFTVAELPFPVTRAAIASSACTSLPATATERAGMLPGGAAVTAVSADGRVLTLRFITGACVSGWGGRVYSATSAVVVGSWSRNSDAGGACAASAAIRHGQVRLPRPLGARVILDAGTGFPVVPGTR